MLFNAVVIFIFKKYYYNINLKLEWSLSFQVIKIYKANGNTISSVIEVSNGD